MYAKVEKCKYQKVTGNARAAILSGRFTASVIAQLLYTYDLMNLRELNYLTLGAQSLSLILALLLPSVGVSLYFYTVPSNDDRSNSLESLDNDVKINVKPKFSLKRAFVLMWQHFIEAYSNPTVVQWSFWWALANAGFLMVQFYVQILWQTIDVDRENLFNAGVEALLTLFGAIAAFLAGFLHSKTFKKYDLWVLALCSLAQGITTIISSYTNNIWVAYSMYVIFGILFSFMITIATAFVAQELADDSFALIFGINTFVALIFQTILTIVIMSWLNLAIRVQFFIFGCYFIGLSVIYLITAFVHRLFCNRNTSTYQVD
jgi:thiamine transporter 2/3